MRTTIRGFVLSGPSKSLKRASNAPIWLVLRRTGRSATRTLSKTGTLKARFNGSGGKFQTLRTKHCAVISYKFSSA